MEGRRAVLELLVARRRNVSQVLIADGLDPSAEIDEISKLAMRSGASVSVVSGRRIDAEARTRSHQGVVARAAPLRESSLEEVLDSDAPTATAPFLMVLDGVTDPQNVGSLLRIAECAGVTGVVFSRHNSVHVTPTVAKVSAGAVEHLRIAIAPGIPAALLKFADADVFTVGLDETASRTIYEIDLDEAASGIALVLGDEGRGLGSLTKKRCDVLASIPQRGRIGSLNVAAAGAIVCFDLARRIVGKSP